MPATSLTEARARVDRNPTPAQIEAGTYRKGHVRVQGLDVTIENPKGSIRRSKPWAHPVWSVRMLCDYGYVKGTEGHDGDQVDVFLGRHLDSPLVFVVNQIDQRTGRFDEHKVMLGFRSLPAAWRAYLAHYPAGWKVGPTTTLTMREFRYWLDHGNHKAELPEWHRPCLWASADSGPELVMKSLVLEVDPDGMIRRDLDVCDHDHSELAKAENAIKTNPKNFLGVDKVGRMHWRSPYLPPQMELPLGLQNLRKGNTSTLLPLADYDKILVSFSGGKDSLAMVLMLLEQGVPKEKIELWHQLVDGEPGAPAFMDWPVTEDYVRKVADGLGIALRYQWKRGGLKGEMERFEAPTAPIEFELGDGLLGRSGGKGPKGTRQKWPLKRADLRVRWCSAYLKIDVGRTALIHDPRFQKPGTKVLVCTGERREESGARAKYAEVVREHGSTRGRRVDQWRPILDWPEAKVWEIIARWKVRPHPAYYLGWGRVSCRSCIFGSKDQWASLKAAFGKSFEEIAAEEEKLGHTIDQNATVRQLAERGVSFVSPDDEANRKLADSKVYDLDVFVPDGWVLPKGAFKGPSGGAP